MSLYARLALALLVAAVLGGAWWKLEVTLDRREQSGYDRRAIEDMAAADAQAASNRELQRLAERRLHVLTTAQTKFLTKTTQEVHDAAAPLAACPVPEPVRVRLNAARNCALGNSAAACGVGDEVPGTR